MADGFPGSRGSNRTGPTPGRRPFISPMVNRTPQFQSQNNYAQQQQQQFDTDDMLYNDYADDFDQRGPVANDSRRDSMFSNGANRSNLRGLQSQNASFSALGNSGARPWEQNEFVNTGARPGNRASRLPAAFGNTGSHLVGPGPASNRQPWNQNQGNGYPQQQSTNTNKGFNFGGTPGNRQNIHAPLSDYQDPEDPIYETEEFQTYAQPPFQQQQQQQQQPHFGASGPGWNNYQDDFNMQDEIDGAESAGFGFEMQNMNQQDFQPQHPYQEQRSYADGLQPYTDPHQGYNVPTQSYRPPAQPSYEPPRPQTVLRQDGRGVNLRSVSELPDRFRALWNFPYFNAIQSQCFDSAFKTERNFVVSAPTGAGKTVILELAIARELMKADRDNVKIVYMAPTRALCTERCRDWSSRFRPLGITCGELTGDTAHNEIRSVQRSNIIVTTPEKWDSISRKWKDYQTLMGMVRLFILDEVHMLGEQKRGATLEVVVCRMKQKAMLNSLTGNFAGGSAASESSVRFVAVSATVPNVHDIAKWLCDSSGVPAEVKVFGEEFRPVILRKEVLSYPKGDRMNEFIFEQNLDSKLLDVLERFSSGKPALIFCATRKSAEHAASTLAKAAVEQLLAVRKHPFIKSAQVQQQLNGLQTSFQDRKLGDLVGNSVAYHHAGLIMEDRRKLENAFLKGDIKVLCTTSTLAVGVNLPAYLVVIKGTCQYANSKYVPISDLDLMQMIGRAGRPQFDDSGVAVIMTDDSSRSKYEALVTGQETIESSLHESLVEHVNAEVVLGTVTDVPQAVKWLKSTFLFIRAKANPIRYRFKTKLPDHLPVDQRLEALALKDLEKLEQHGFVKLREGKVLESTELGAIMAKFYIRFETMVEICKLKPGASVKDVLETLSKASEFLDATRMNMGDKTILNDLNKKPGLRFPIKGKVKGLDDKISLLIQAALGAVPIVGQNAKPIMAQEQSYVVLQAQRIARCILEVAVEKKDFKFARSALEMMQSLHAKTWAQGGTLLRQLEGLGPEYAKKLDLIGVRDFAALRACQPGRIEMAVGRQPPFGHKVLESLSALPQFELKLRKFQEIDSPELELFVSLSLLNSPKGSPSVVLMCGLSDGPLIEFHRFYCSKLQNGPIELRFRVPIQSTSTRVYVRVMCEDYVGLDIAEEIVPEINPRLFMRIMQLPKTGERPASATSAQVTLADLMDKQAQEAGNDVQGSPAIDDAVESWAGFDGIDDSAFLGLDDAQNDFGLAQEVEGNAAKPPIGDEHSGSPSLPSKDDSATKTPAPLQPAEQIIKAPIYRPLQPLREDQGVEIVRRSGSGLGAASSGPPPPPLPPAKPAPSKQQKQQPQTQQRHEVGGEDTQNSQELEGDNVPCAHFCKEKKNCRHLCCKTGIPRKMANKRRRPESADPDLSQFFQPPREAAHELEPEAAPIADPSPVQKRPRKKANWDFQLPVIPDSLSSTSSSELEDLRVPRKKLKRVIRSDDEDDAEPDKNSGASKGVKIGVAAVVEKKPKETVKRAKMVDSEEEDDEDFFNLASASKSKTVAKASAKTRSPIVVDLEEPDFVDLDPERAETTVDHKTAADLSPHLPPVPSSTTGSKPTTWTRKMYDDLPPEPAPVSAPKLGLAALNKFRVPPIPTSQQQKMEPSDVDGFKRQGKAQSLIKPSKNVELPAVPTASTDSARLLPKPTQENKMKANAGTNNFRSWLKNLHVED